MTPKEKAKELIDKFKKISIEIEEKDSIYYKRIGLENAKQCALIHTKELIKHLKAYSAGDLVIFYREVDKEINNLKK